MRNAPAKSSNNEKIRMDDLFLTVNSKRSARANVFDTELDAHRADEFDTHMESEAAGTWPSTKPPHLRRELVSSSMCHSFFNPLPSAVRSAQQLVGRLVQLANGHVQFAGPGIIIVCDLLPCVRFRLSLQINFYSSLCTGASPKWNMPSYGDSVWMLSRRRRRFRARVHWMVPFSGQMA